MKRMQPAKSRALWLVLGAWCILLLGCQKPYETTKLPESISLNVTLSNTLQSDDKKRDHGLSYTQSLLSLISDETLKELLEIALANNTDILTLTSQIAQARENLGLASANMLPQLGLNLGYNYSSGNYNRYQININQNTLNANLSLSWELDLFGKLNMLRKSKKFEYLAALSNLEAAKVSLIGEVATNFYTLQKVRNDILLNEQIVENNEKILKIAQAKYKLGLLDIATLSPLINTLASSKSSLNTLKLQEEQTKNALLVLLNTKDSTTITTLIGLQEAIILPDTTLPVIDDLPQEILLGREDIQASIANLNAQAGYTTTQSRHLNKRLQNPKRKSQAGILHTRKYSARSAWRNRKCHKRSKYLQRFSSSTNSKPCKLQRAYRNFARPIRSWNAR